MKLTRRSLKYCVALSLFFSLPYQNLHAAPPNFKPFRLGLQGAFVKDPWPSLVGTNATLTLFDTLRVMIGAGWLKTLLISSYIGGPSVFSWGYSAQVKIPGLMYSPVIGIGYSQLHTYSNDKFFGGRRVDRFLTPMVGLEIQDENMSWLYYGVGVFFVLQQKKSGWEADRATFILTGQETIAPYPTAYMGFRIF